MRTGAIVCLGLMLLIAACDRQLVGAGALRNGAAAAGSRGPNPFQKADVPPDNTMTNHPADLIGVWHTKAASLGSPETGIVVTITGDRIEAASGCVRFAWTYRFEAMALQLTRAAAGSCERGLTPLEAGFQAAMEASTRAHHRSGRGLVFEGPNSTVSLFEHAQ